MCFAIGRPMTPRPMKPTVSDITSSGAHVRWLAEFTSGTDWRCETAGVRLSSTQRMNLQGKVALITGAKRIGAVVAATLAGRGTNVALSYARSEVEARAA